MPRLRCSGNMNAPDLARPWRARILRLSVFPERPEPSLPDMWAQVMSEIPEIDQAQPRQHSRIQAAPWRETMQMQLTTLPIRIDWVAVGDEEKRSDWPTIADALPDFVDVTRRWLESLSVPVKRLAVGVQGMIEVPERGDGYRLLNDLLKAVELDADNTSDFLYNINRPIESRMLAMRLNRVTKWACIRLQMTMAAPGIEQSQPMAAGYYVSLECDHNTPAEREEALPQDRLSAIYDELIDLALANLEFGEVPP